MTSSSLQQPLILNASPINKQNDASSYTFRNNVLLTDTQMYKIHFD